MVYDVGWLGARADIRGYRVIPLTHDDILFVHKRELQGRKLQEMDTSFGHVFGIIPSSHET